MRARDDAVARKAAQRHGVVTSAELARCGLDHHAIGRRVAAGRLHRVHRGVYAVGHPGLSVPGRYVAAALAAGPSARVSHRAAAHVLHLVRGAAPPPEVLVATGHRVRVPGVIVHRTRCLHPRECSELDGMPITTVPRVLVDLAAVLDDEDELGRACHQAFVLHDVTPAMVDAVLARAPNRRGTARLRALLHGDAPIVLSRMERRFLTLLREHRLPLPETNRRTAGGFVDCRWPAQRLVVELDSYRFHATRRAFEDAMRRERAARAAGFEHRRYCWADVAEQPAAMLAELRALLRGRDCVV